MDRRISALIYFLLIGLPASVVFAQRQGQVLNNHGLAVYDAGIFCKGTLIGTTDSLGRFSVNCDSDTLVFISPEYATKTEYWPEKDTKFRKITIHYSENTLVDYVLVARRLSYFDIGYLPPVKGVQIATGTSTIIQTEGQSGAKSTGNPRELFAKVPGLNIWESDGAGIQMGVGGRGLSPNRAANFNMRQNGYDISADALGYPESYYTPPLEALSAIEIIRGSASLQYGTQFGGLMNFVIKNPSGSKISFTSRNTIGNYGYYGNFHRVSGTLNRFEYQAYYQLKTGDGYRPNSEFTQHQGFAQIGYAINEHQNIRLEYTRMSYIARQPGGLTDAQFEQNPRQSSRARNWFSVDWNVLALHYDWKIRQNLLLNIRTFGMLSQRSSLGFLGTINKADPGGTREMIRGDFKNAGAEARLLKKYRFGRDRERSGAFLTGVRYYQGRTTSLQGKATNGDGADFRFANETDLENSNYSFPSKNAAVFAENIWFLTNRWNVNAGVRMEYIISSSDGYYKQYSIHPLTGDTLAAYRIDGTNTVERYIPLGGLGTSYKTGKTTSAYANFCMNYRAVNFNDIRVSNPNVLVDTNIRDEYGYTAELGWRGAVQKYFYADASLFYIFYGDKIGLAPEGVKKIRTNIGDAVNKGVELFAEWDFIKTFNDSARVGCSVFVNASYIDAHYVRSREANYVGKEVEYVSRVMLKGGLKLRNERWQLQIQGSYNSPQFTDASNAIEPTGDAVIGQIPAYFVADFSARYIFRRYFQLEAGVNNLLNASYYTRRATAYPGPGILPSDGRTLYFTLQFQLDSK